MSFTELVAAAAEAERSGDWDVAFARYERALEGTGSAGAEAETDEAGQRVTLLRSLGRVQYQRGNLVAADELFREGSEIARSHGLTGPLAALCSSRAVVAQFSGRPEQAQALYAEAHELALKAGDETLAANVEQNLGTLANMRGDVRGALVHYRSALFRYRALGDDTRAAGVLNNIGMAHVDDGDWEAAEGCFDEALYRASRGDDPHAIGSIETNRAEMFLKLRRWADARESCDRAFEVFVRTDARRWLGEVHRHYGTLYRETGKLAMAHHYLDLAAGMASETHDRLLEAEVCREFALVHLAEGNNNRALKSLNQAATIFGELQAKGDARELETRLDELEGVFFDVMRSWAETIEAKDRYTAGHCERVADYTCRLAEAVGVTGRDLTWMRMGAFLHDVGKTIVPAEVLNKPGKLSPEEWELMKSHTTAGDEIVAELEFPWDIGPMVRSHHERWDGGGYPDGLAAEAIPLHARILCIADVFDALTTARSYRPAMPVEEALRIMEADSGRLFDPQLFEVFRMLIADQLAGPRRTNYSDLKPRMLMLGGPDLPAS